MRAVVVDRWMEPSQLCVSELSAPEVTPGSVRIDVRAAGCNFADILMAQGRYQVKPPFPFIPGGEVAGVVESLGEGVSGLSVGDRVLAAPGLGAFAEQVVVPAAAAYPLPESMSFEEGAALPIVYGTSYAALVLRGQLQAGENLLVHAAAGGVGLAAVQIGKALGARVLATAGGAEKLQVAGRAGADVLMDYRQEDFALRVRAETAGRGADLIFDPVGGEIFDRSLKCIAWGGRLLVIGFASGHIPRVKANRILLKHISLVGVHWGGMAEHEPETLPRIFEALFELHRQQKISPLISDSYPLEELPTALEALGARRTHGKVIVTPAPQRA